MHIISNKFWYFKHFVYKKNFSAKILGPSRCKVFNGYNCISYINWQINFSILFYLKVEFFRVVVGTKLIQMAASVCHAVSYGFAVSYISPMVSRILSAVDNTVFKIKKKKKNLSGGDSVHSVSRSQSLTDFGLPG